MSAASREEAERAERPRQSGSEFILKPQGGNSPEVLGHPSMAWEEAYGLDQKPTSACVHTHKHTHTHTHTHAHTPYWSYALD